MKTYGVTGRFVLHVGYACNMRCEFCYYLENLENGTTVDWTTEENKKKINIAASLGKSMIDISGGEPTIREDLPDLISYCKSIKSFNSVCLITNGIKTSNPDYSKLLAKSGLDEGLFSIHSHNSAIHDSLTHVKGSHEKILKSVKNFHDLGLKVRINTVITNENYKHLDNYLEMCSSLKPNAVNLIVFNPSDTASHTDITSRIRVTDYHLIGNEITKALDKWKPRFKTINVRFLPFCLLPSHKDCIRTQWQKFHEDQEWDPILNILFQKGRFAVAATALAGLILPIKAPKYKPRDFVTFINKRVRAIRMRLYYRKGNPCKKCAVNRICTGFQRDYVNKFGFPDVEPIQGTEIKDPLHYCGNYLDHCFTSSSTQN